MLVAYFGRNNVIRKNKCIHIQENTYRTEIDVVPTWEHRTYIGENNDPYNFIEELNSGLMMGRSD